MEEREQGKGNREQELESEEGTWERNLRPGRFVKNVKANAKRSHGQAKQSERDLCGFEGAKPGAAREAAWKRSESGVEAKRSAQRQSGGGLMAD